MQTSKGAPSLLLTCFALAAMFGCGDTKMASNTSSDRVEYQRIIQMAHASRAPVSLCQLIHSPRVSGGGLYVVEQLSGAAELDLHPGGTVQGFTYVRLKLVDSWFSAEQRPTARIFGGKFASGQSGGWDISLSVGQTVGVMFTRASAENRDYPYMSPAGTFVQKPDGGYSNGELFVERAIKEAELGVLIRSIANAADCKTDVLPDAPTAPADDPETDVTSTVIERLSRDAPDGGPK